MNREKLKKEMLTLLKEADFLDFTREYGITGWNAFEKWFDEKYKPTPITEQGLLDRGFKMRIYNNVIRHYYIPCTPENYRKANKYELFVTFNERLDSKPDEVCREGWAPVLGGTIHSFHFKTMEDIEEAYNLITKKELPYAKQKV
jgi:hypothetical protein